MVNNLFVPSPRQTKHRLLITEILGNLDLPNNNISFNASDVI
jgi:hypothetical protein